MDTFPLTLSLGNYVKFPNLNCRMKVQAHEAWVDRDRGTQRQCA